MGSKTIAEIACVSSDIKEIKELETDGKCFCMLLG